MATPIKSARKLAQEIRVARNLTQERLKKILNYDPQTGVFTWTKALINGLKRGRVAGRIIGNGERIIKVFGVNFPASSLAFLYMTGNWPTGSLAFLCMKGNWPRNRVEYVNGDKSNTSWGNLGQVSRPASARNPLARPKATYGVYEREEGSWEVRAWQNGKWTDIGTFPSEADATAAARAALLLSNTEAIADKAPEYRIEKTRPADKVEAIVDEVPIEVFEPIVDDSTKDAPPVLGE